MSSQLTLTIDNADLTQLLQSNSQVVLVRPVPGSQYAVVWAAFQPFSQNQVSWNEQYGLYAAGDMLAPGVRLNPVATEGNSLGQSFVFNSYFQPTGPGPGGNQCQVLNQLQGPPTAFGLTQAVVVNGREQMAGPIGAQAVPAEAQALLFAPDSIMLLVAQGLQAGTVLGQGQYQGNVFPTSANTTLNLQYRNGQFVMGF